MSGIHEIRISRQRYVRIQSANRLIGIGKERERREENPLEKMGWGVMIFVRA